MSLTGAFPPRDGFALAAAIASIVIIAVLATAALFASGQESRATAMEIAEQQAMAYADRAARVAIDDWSCPTCDAMAAGGVYIERGPALPSLEGEVQTIRLDSTLYLVVGVGRVVGSGGNIRLERRISIAAHTSRDSAGAPRARPIRQHSWAALYGM